MFGAYSALGPHVKLVSDHAEFDEKGNDLDKGTISDRKYPLQVVPTEPDPVLDEQRLLVSHLVNLDGLVSGYRVTMASSDFKNVQTERRVAR